MRIRDLPGPVTAAKADWLPGTTWIGFTPKGPSTRDRASCQATVQRQFGDGYIIEYVTESFSDPNEGFESDPALIEERERHREVAGRLIAVHKLKHTSRKLDEIIGQTEYGRLQDMWAKDQHRLRWSVAFPIIQSYDVVGRPKARDVFSTEAYHHLFRYSTATLRPLRGEDRAVIANLAITERKAGRAYIGIEDEFPQAEGSQINPVTFALIEEDLPAGGLEGMTAEKWVRVKTRAAWVADRFIRERQSLSRLQCDDCGFDPAPHVAGTSIKARSLLDVHHKNPLAEGVRYTDGSDFALLCPTCHRLEHEKLRAGIARQPHPEAAATAD